MEGASLDSSRHRTLAALCALLGLAACSGGGSGDPPPAALASEDDPAATVQTTVDVPVETLSQSASEESAEPVAGYATAPGVEACSVADLNAKVDFDMRDYYIYYDRVPRPNLDDFESPEALMPALRVDPDVYSYVTEDAESVSLFEEGVTDGYGFWFRPASDGAVRFREILFGSSADRAGLARGDELVAIEGVAIDEYDDAALQAALSDESGTLSLTVRTDGGPAREVELVDEPYRWETAPAASVLTHNATGTRVGVVEVHAFLETTEAEIDRQVEFLAGEGIDELVVDFRYNPGGRSRVAGRLASQIGGEGIAGEVYQIGRANDRYDAEFGFESTFERVSTSLGLSRVIVLATGFSASASEAVINGLEPYVDVVVVGSRTAGKPFSSFSESYCDRSINAMSLLRTNAVGVDVAGGIEPDCAVEDDWLVPADDPDDALLGAGLDYVLTGACPVPAMVALGADRRARSRGPEVRATGAGRTRALDLVDR